MPSWDLHFLKLESTLDPSDLVALAGFMPNPQLQKIAAVAGIEPHLWFKMVSFPLVSFMESSYGRARLLVLKEHAPSIHIETMLAKLRPYMNDSGFTFEGMARCNSDSPPRVRVLFGMCGLEESTKLEVCYLEELLVVKRRAHVVMVELPGHRLWLEMRGMWVPKHGL